MKRSDRSEEHTSELQSRGLISYAVFCLKKKTLQTAVACAEANDCTHTSPAAGSPAPCIIVAKPMPRDFAKRPLRVGYLLFFNDPAATEISTLSLHAALPI